MVKVVIVGGVAGGASCAARLRRMDEKAEIVVLDKGEYVSFANCGLPYHISGEIENRDALILNTPESLKARFNFEVRLSHEVTSIDTKNKKVKVKELKTGNEYDESYDKLLLSPGAAPIVPPLPGIDNPRTFTLRTVPDMDKILSLIDTKTVKNVVVVGGGYIGLEMGECLQHRGLNVTILELFDQVMAPLDMELASLLHKELLTNNIDLKLKTGLLKLLHKEKENKVVCTVTGDVEIETDMVMMVVGVRPEVSLARDAHLTIGKSGGIWVDEGMRTSDPDIYAVGDAVEDTCFVTGNPCCIPLAGPANRSARVAADNILGGSRVYKNTQGTGVCRVFNLTVAMTGVNEKTLKRYDVPYEKIFLHASQHASYYPGATPISLKLLYDGTTGKILGCQAVGNDGVDKRVDVIATAMRGGLTAMDLEDIELCYAPPVGSAKDIINLAGFVASNVKRGEARLCTWESIATIDKNKTVIVDVRNTDEYNGGNINGSINIPLHTIRERLSEIPKDKEIIVYCMVGLRGHVANKILLHNGYDCKNLTGGWLTYEAATWTMPRK
eukprot:GHVR01008471.1.p1 GENE.GHVR01008471.1~~GHVR01008471.1.p1  ORF type:complete len:568 (+),score=159.29 GHVR01008471.1:38-1705(+)